MRIGAEKQGRSFRGRTSGVSSLRANATGATAAPPGDVGQDAQDPENEALISEGRSFEQLSWPPHSDGFSLSNRHRGTVPC